MRLRRRSARFLRPGLVCAGVLLAAAALTACDDDTTGPSLDSYDAAALSITAAEMDDHARFLAHDSMLGRWSPSPQLNTAARYIADRFAEAGLRAGGSDGYLQWFAVPFKQIQPGDATGVSTASRTAANHPSFSLVPAEPDDPSAAPNVIGWVQGSDPQLRDEVIVFSAHFDHIGVSPVAGPGGDTVYNGADDNASGTVALIEIAEAFGSLATPPARTVVFLATSAEEQGLHGAYHYAYYPAFPMQSTVANVNMDMVGRNDPATVGVIRRTASPLGQLVQEVTSDHPEVAVSPIDQPDDALMTRSDCGAFLAFGVDAVFFHSGLHADYHGLDDEPDRLDTGKIAAVAQLAFWVGVELADRPN